MRTSSVLTLFVCSLRALAIPSKIYGPIWSLAHAGGSKTPPVPTSITRQFPQFNTSQWEAYHCLTLNKLETIISNCAVYCEDYTLRAVKDGFGRDGCHPDDFPCHCANSQRISNVCQPAMLYPILANNRTDHRVMYLPLAKQLGNLHGGRTWCSTTVRYRLLPILQRHPVRRLSRLWHADRQRDLCRHPDWIGTTCFHRHAEVQPLEAAFISGARKDEK